MTVQRNLGRVTGYHCSLGISSHIHNYINRDLVKVTLVAATEPVSVGTELWPGCGLSSKAAASRRPVTVKLQFLAEIATD